jgi:hypothetical protein
MKKTNETLLNIDEDDIQNSAAAQLQFQEFTRSHIGVAELDVTASAKDHNISFQNPNANGQQDSENQEEGQKTGPSFWAFSYYQQFFDVNTDQVINRVLYSMIPRPSKNYLENVIKSKPDLYGPFWVCVTLVFTIAVSRNLVSYQNFLHKLTTVTAFHWKYDFHTVSYAATGIFSYAWLVPLAIWGVLWWQGGQPTVTFLEMLCIYGYSLSIFIPISVLWVVQLGWLQWLLLGLAAGTSGGVLVLSLLPAARAAGSRTSLPLCLVILAAHVLLATAVMLLFFNASDSESISHLSSTITSQLSEAVHHLNITNAPVT